MYTLFPICSPELLFPGGRGGRGHPYGPGGNTPQGAGRGAPPSPVPSPGAGGDRQQEFDESVSDIISVWSVFLHKILGLTQLCETNWYSDTQFLSTIFKVLPAEIIGTTHGCRKHGSLWLTELFHCFVCNTTTQ